MWNKVYEQKEKGGLRVIDIRIFNYALFLGSGFGDLCRKRMNLEGDFNFKVWRLEEFKITGLYQ